MFALSRGSVARFACFCFVLLIGIPGSLAASPQPRADSSASVAELASRAESGDASAKQRLAQFLLHSEPTAEGYDLAIAWLRSLASRNVPQARFLLGYLYVQGRGLPRDYAKGAENYQAAALQGLTSAQNNLADLYQRGLGVPKSDHKAVELYMAAAKHANPVAQFNLASMLLTGCGTGRDFSEAARWFRAAAEDGYAPAQHFLAILDSKGLGVPVDRSEAARWERLAAQHGYPEAETGLAHFYETGEGVPLDYVAAYDWYSRASAAGDSAAADHLKDLSQVMTRKQVDRAKAVLSVESSSPRTPSNSTKPDSTSSGDDSVLRDGFGSIGPTNSP